MSDETVYECEDCGARTDDSSGFNERECPRDVGRMNSVHTLRPVVGRTPGPWTFDEHGGTFYVFGPDGGMVADGDDAEPWIARIRGVGRGATVEEQRANAAHIVEACNAHDELVAALKTLRIDANRLADRNLGGTYEDDVRRAIAGADAALSKVSSPRVSVKKTP